MSCRQLFLTFTALVLAAIPARSAELTVAAAADLKFAMDEMVDAFRNDHPMVRVKSSYGSSGNFHAQIRNGAPYDLYFSADISYPKKLADDGFALDGGVSTYAIGRLVVWVPKSSPIDLKAEGIRSLLHPSVRKVSVANPAHAPYGAAAIAVMKELGVHETVEPKLVLGENVAQAAHFVRSGAAEIGVVALSLALAPEMSDGRHWEIPQDAFPRLVQGGMILRTSKSPGAARTFRDFVLGEKGRGVLARHGFLLPEAK